METAEHREPYESRGSRTDLGAPGGESPPGDSTVNQNILEFFDHVLLRDFTLPVDLIRITLVCRMLRKVNVVNQKTDFFARFARALLQ